MAWAVRISDDDALAYYRANPERFTEPKSERVSLILVGVDPSSPREAWDEAMQRARELHGELRNGASFADLARAHSSDPTAENGGDMGYLHTGMTGDSFQAAVDALQSGEFSEPFMILEGVAIVMLTDRIEPHLQAFEEVKERARGLQQREAEAAAILAGLGALAFSNGYSRNHEDQADRVGMRYAYEGGYDVSKGPRLWERFASRATLCRFGGLGHGGVAHFHVLA